MPLSTSLLALLLLALSGGVAASWVEAPSADVPTEAPVSHDEPADAEETDGEEDGVRAARVTLVAHATASMRSNEVVATSMDRAVHSPPPER